MKLGIMQPYFFPYIGYWQLLNAVDTYVVYDDVNFIKGGWINRNRILIGKEPQYINLKMTGASPNKLINEVRVADDATYVKKLIKTIEQNYCGAPYFDDTMPLLLDILNNPQKNLGLFLFDHITMVAKHLGIETEIRLSSSLEKDCTLRGEDKIIHICKRMGADEYYNSIGGVKLYSKERFADEGITLHFLETDEIVYQQCGDTFFSNLSIIDVMMFNGKGDICRMLQKYRLT